MPIKNKIFYNKMSSEKLGWDPSWFGADEFADDLIDKIMEFQTKYSLDVDGLCGPMTFRRAFTEREAVVGLIQDKLEESADNKKYIVCNSKMVEIAWDKVVNTTNKDNLALPTDCYKTVTNHDRQPTMIVTHYDVCLSAASCKRVLEKKGISSHFAIDNDGTIYQMVDTQNIGWHAGNRKVNEAAIGVDISNAVYTKYQNYYRKKGFGNRPLLENVKVHGTKVKECLGFYPIQIEAYKVLVETLCKHYDIPLAMPMATDGTVLRAEHAETKKGKFKGIVNHFHVTRGKWDTANLDWDQVLKDLRETKD